MRGRWKVLLLCALMLPLAGCETPGILPYARELADMAPIRTMGVDAADDGAVTVTVSSGVQGGQGEEPVVLSGTAGTISGACLDMQGQGTSYIYYGHVGQFLLGEALAGRGVGPALDYVLRDVEMRLGTQLYLVKEGDARSVMEEAVASGGSAADRLEAMEDDAGLLSDTMPVAIGDVLERLSRSGSAFVPAVRQGEEGLRAAGYGILKDGLLEAWAEGEEAEGVNLAMGRVDADVLELEGAALRVVGASTTVSPVFQGDTLTGLTVLCRVDANLAEAPPNADVDALCRALEEAEGARVRAALDLSQALDADFLELKRRACLALPWRKAAIEAQWDLPALTLEVKMDGRILRSYDAGV